MCFPVGKEVGLCLSLSYSLLLDLVAAAGLSLRDLDLCREIASHVVVGRLVAAVGQYRAVGAGTSITVTVDCTVLPVVAVGSAVGRDTTIAGSTAIG